MPAVRAPGQVSPTVGFAGRPRLSHSGSPRGRYSFRHDTAHCPREAAPTGRASGQVVHQTDAVRLLGVSRQRVSRILKDEGITLNRRPLRTRHTCRVWGREYDPGPLSSEDTCYRCLAGARRVTLVCPLCGKSRVELRSQVGRNKSEVCGTCWKQKEFPEVGRQVAARRRARKAGSPAS
jgi:hypothetical protein